MQKGVGSLCGGITCHLFSVNVDIAVDKEYKLIMRAGIPQKHY
jgi:hypothetical protein